MKLFRLLSVLGLLSVFVLPRASAQEGTVPSVHVQGQAAVSVVPDAFSVSLILEQRGPVVSKLNAQLEQELGAVVSFLLQQGVEEKHIQSMQVQLSPWYEHGPNGRQDNGFVLTRQVNITHTDLQSYDDILDGVLSRGVKRIQQFDFIALDQDQAYQQALVLAVRDARARATLLAKELGVAVGEVLSIRESSPHQPVPMMRVDAMAREASPSLPGQHQINASIQVSFAIANDP